MYVFPHPNLPERNGMTLRDYFAGQALAGLLSNDSGRGYPHVSKDAYLYADAMLKKKEEL